MRRLHWYGLCLVLLLLLAGTGGWLRPHVLADAKREAKPDKDSEFGKFLYPGTKSQQAFEKKDIPARTATFATEDDPDKVIKWYKEAIPRLTPGVVEGVGVDGAGEPYRETVFAVSDSRSKAAKEAADRPVTVWVATARVSTDKVENYTLTVVVTRGKDEARTHVTLTWLPGPRKDKK
jgi:hypothetical protein